MRSVGALVVVFAISLGVVIVARQQSAVPQPVFRAEGNLVRVDVSVLDASRHPIHGLTAADFTLLEDGKPQPIVACSEVSVPDSADAAGTWGRDVAPDVRTNTAEDGRLMIILIDDAMLKSDVKGADTTASVKNIAHRIVDRLGPTDVAAVVFTYDKNHVQDFTTDHARLLATIASFSPKQFSLGTAGSTIGGGVNINNTWRYDSFDAFTHVAKFLVSAPARRKALVFIRPGDPVQLSDREAMAARSTSNQAGPGASLIAGRMQDMFEWVERAGVTVYLIDPGDLAKADAVSSARKDFGGDAAISMNLDPRLNATRGTLTSTTGGFSVTSNGAFDAGLDQMFLETGSYYLLGYAPPQPFTTQRREIHVDVNRPGAMVHGRTGYYYSPPVENAKAVDPLLSALANVLPNADVPLQVSAVPFMRPDGHGTSVTVTLGVTESGVTAPASDHVDVQIRAFTERGDARGTWSETADAKLHTVNAVRDAHFDITTTVDLKPGKYELRVSAHSALLNRTGSVYVDIDVPDFSDAPVSLSGIVLTANASLAPRANLAPLLPFTPTTARAFARTEHVAALVRLYESKLAPASIETRITSQDNTVVFTSTQTMAVDGFTPLKSADYRLNLPLATLPPGSYLITIEARSGKSIAARAIRFAVK